MVGFRATYRLGEPIRIELFRRILLKSSLAGLATSAVSIQGLLGQSMPAAHYLFREQYQKVNHIMTAFIQNR